MTRKEIGPAFMKYAGKISTNRVLVSLRDSFLYASGATILAGFIIMLTSVFFDPNSSAIIWGDTGLNLGELMYGSYDAFASSGLFTSLSNIQSFLYGILNGTINIYSILVLVSLTRELHKNFIGDPESETTVMLYALGAFYLALPWSVQSGDTVISGIADSSYLGTSGVFTAMLVAFISVFTYNFVVKRGWTIKMPKGVPAAVERSFGAMIPGLVVLLVFMFINILLVELTPVYASITGFEGVLTLPSFIVQTLQIPLLGLSQSMLFSLIVVSGQNILQLFGIHGSSVFGPIIGSTWTVLGLENISGAAQNIVTDLFFNTYVVVEAFALTPLLAMFLFSKQTHIRKLAKFATVPALFNISEPITYGLPIVLNPYFFVPYLVCPPLFFFLTQFLTEIGIVPIVVNAVPWTTPILINGILATGTLFGGIWQLVLLAIGVLIWAPFIKAYDRHLEQTTVSEEN